MLAQRRRRRSHEPSDVCGRLTRLRRFWDRAEREQVIRKALDAATRTIPGARWREDKPLVTTVVNLTEFPSVILGSFDPEFLALPEEVLVTVMRDHQKYFAIEDANGKLLPHFLAVLNTDGDSDGLIRHGNERVLRARFNDARFFWQTDQKQNLRERVELLKHVTFQKDLGSYYDKTLRVQHLASWLSETVKQSGMAIRPGVVHKAALLAKTDLTTELVKEFTELQGIVGGLYARVQTLDDDMRPEVQAEVANAIYDHYKPESMEDDGSADGRRRGPFDRRQGGFDCRNVCAWPGAERIEGSVCVTAAGERNCEDHCRAQAAVAAARDHGRRAAAVSRRGGGEEIYECRLCGIDARFFRERLEFYLKEARGHAYDVVNAVLAADADDVVDAAARAEAVSKVRGSADFESISIAFKRMKNILRQAAENKRRIADRLDAAALVEESEKDLAASIPQTARAGRELRASAELRAGTVGDCAAAARDRQVF